MWCLTVTAASMPAAALTAAGVLFCSCMMVLLVASIRCDGKTRHFRSTSRKPITAGTPTTGRTVIKRYKPINRGSVPAHWPRCGTHSCQGEYARLPASLVDVSGRLVRSYVLCDVAKPLLSRGFAVFGGCGFCLLQVQGDGGVEEFEDAALGFGGDGEGGHDGPVGAVLDVVAGQGAQVAEQGPEGPDRLVVGRSAA